MARHKKLVSGTVTRLAEPDRFVGGTIASSLPLPLIMIGAEGKVLYANQAAEQFFQMGVGFLLRQKLADLVPFGSPLLQLVHQTRERGASIAERNVDLISAGVVLALPRSLSPRGDVDILPRAALSTHPPAPNISSTQGARGRVP